jgi:hypothetical protein
MKFFPIPITSCIKAATCTWSKIHKDNPFNSIHNYFHLKVSNYHIQRKDLPWETVQNMSQTVLPALKTALTDTFVTTK